MSALDHVESKLNIVRANRRGSALLLANSGLRVFPLKANSKEPAIFGWQEKATTDPAIISSWWSGDYRDCNVGVATGRGLMVLDADVKGGKPGLESLARLLKETAQAYSLQVKTPSGGMHVYLRVPRETHIPCGVGSIAGYPGIDVRGDGGLVASIGSDIDHNSYLPVPVPVGSQSGILAASESLIAVCRKRARQSRDKNREPITDLDTSHALKRAMEYLKTAAPKAIAFEGGNDTTYKVAARIRDLGISEGACFDLMGEHWNETGKAEPPWDAQELQTIIGNAYAYATGAPGAMSGIAEFDAVEIAPRVRDQVTLGDWDEPANLWRSDAEPPALPTGLLPDLIEQYARDRGRRLGVDAGGVAALTVASLSSLIHASNCIQVPQCDPHWTERPILWAMLIGNPGSNKSATLSQAIDPVLRLEQKWNRDHARAVAAVTDFSTNPDQNTGPASNPRPKPKRRRKIINDATIEAVAEILAENEGGLLLFKDELSGFFGGMDAYRSKGERDRPFWIEAKEGKPFNVDRKGLVFVVPRNAVSIIGGIQPDKIQSIASKLTDDGLLQRFWPIWIKQAGAPEDDFANDLLDAAVLKLAADMSDGPTNRRYRFAPEAATELAEIQSFKKNQLMRIETGSYATFIDKLPGGFARVALAFHFIDWYADDLHELYDDEPPELISAGTARRARLFLTEFIVPHAAAFYKRLVQTSGAESHASWIAGYILAHGTTRIEERDIYRSYSALSARDKRRERLSAMHELEAKSWVKPTGYTHRDGGPACWEVNPSVFDGRFAVIARREASRRVRVKELIEIEAEKRRAEKANSPHSEAEAAARGF